MIWRILKCAFSLSKKRHISSFEKSRCFILPHVSFCPGLPYHKLRKTFSKFYTRYYDLKSKFQVGLKSSLRQGLSEPELYGDLVYKLKRSVGSNNFSA